MAETKPKLLIVEDDEGLQAQLKWAYDDYEVVIAGTREAALAAMRAEEPEVVTLDLGLPPDPARIDRFVADVREGDLERTEGDSRADASEGPVLQE